MFTNHSLEQGITGYNDVLFNTRTALRLPSQAFWCNCRKAVKLSLGKVECNYLTVLGTIKMCIVYTKHFYCNGQTTLLMFM